MAIALDSGDPNLVREFAAAGALPTLARLLEQAAVVHTRPPMGVFVSANWPTIFTATRPDRHGYLCWDEYREGTYEYRQTDPTMIRGQTIWRRMSDAGKRVAVFDVPHTVVEDVNGVMVSEWGCHDRHFGPRSSPPELVGELNERHGKHFGSMRAPGFDQFAPCDYAHRIGSRRTREEEIAFFDAVHEGAEMKESASLDLLDRGGWDFFLSVLGETHCSGHQFWHLHDPAHPGFDPELAERFGGDPVRTIYSRVDAALGEHLARLGPEDTLYVLMPHGMTAHHDGDHLLDDVLFRLDRWLDEPNSLGRSTRAAAEAAGWIPRGLRGPALRAATPLIRRAAGSPRADQIPPKEGRRWFQVPNNTVVGALRLNLRGREPGGQIEPADMREAQRWLADRLAELVNVETGGRVVRHCRFTDDVYDRKPGDAFADVYVEWERSAPIERVWSPTTGTVAGAYDHWRQGDHRQEGMMLAVGPGIRPGNRRGTFESTDLGATLAAAVGVPLEDVDGRAIASVLPAPVRSAARRDRALNLARGQLETAVRKRAAGRIPRWAKRAEPTISRLRHDLGERADRTDAELAALNDKVAELERHSKIAAMSAWLPHAEVSEELLVNVVMPTRDRRQLLAEAIDSVKAQSYTHWELLVVDDGSTDDTSSFLGEIEDPRVRVLRSDGVGVCAARNLGLDAARGDAIAYLDDDNRFDPQWLKAVVLALAANPQESLYYGARVFDDEGRVTEGVSSGLPGIQFVEWDAEAIREHNFIDMNVLAHRRGPVRFDEELAHLGDWDLLLRLAPDADPVEIPAIAVYYRSDVAGRLSTTLPSEELDREYLRVRRKLAKAALS